MTRADEDAPEHAYEPMATVALADGTGDAIIYRRREINPRPVPRVGRGDLWESLVLVSAVAVARTTRHRTWDRFCELLVRTPLKRPPNAVHRIRNTVTALPVEVPRDDPAELARLVHGRRLGLFRQRMLYAAELAGRQSATEIQFLQSDAERIRTALARGRGVIVWVDPTSAGPVIAKRALKEAGLAPSHVSADTHGMSQTEFGIAVLNGIHTRVENRYLAERLMFHRDAGADVTRRILRVLKAGGVVTMTNSCYAGVGFVELPLGRNGWVSMATAALSLAVRHDVPLFSMAAIETEPFARYQIELGPEIGPESEAAPQGVAPGDHDRVAAAAASVRDTLLDRLRRWPDQYPGISADEYTSTRFPRMRDANTGEHRPA